ncbi:MAG: hypothetical protein NTW98_00715 [Candidatus Nomurabacteria bacterium]|nr:hypothetical protein [Candidatus Nomurabacteria bacterium]
MESVNIKPQASEVSPGQVLFGLLDLNKGSNPMFVSVLDKLKENTDLAKVVLTPEELKLLLDTIDGYIKMEPRSGLAVSLNQAIDLLKNK